MSSSSSSTPSSLFPSSHHTPILSDSTARLASLRSSLSSFSKGIKNEASDIRQIFEGGNIEGSKPPAAIINDNADKFLSLQYQRINDVERRLLDITDKALNGGESETTITTTSALKSQKSSLDTALPLKDVLQLFRLFQESNNTKIDALESTLEDYGYRRRRRQVFHSLNGGDCRQNNNNHRDDGSGHRRRGTSSNNFMDGEDEMLADNAIDTEVGQPLEQVVEVDNETDGTVTTCTVGTNGTPTSVPSSATFKSPLSLFGKNSYMPSTPTIESLNLSGITLSNLNEINNYVSPLATPSETSGSSHLKPTAPAIKSSIEAKSSTLDECKNDNDGRGSRVKISSDECPPTKMNNEEIMPSLQTPTRVKSNELMKMMTDEINLTVTPNEELLVTPVRPHFESQYTVEELCQPANEILDCVKENSSPKANDASDKSIKPCSKEDSNQNLKPFSSLFSSLLKTPEVKNMITRRTILETEGVSPSAAFFPNPQHPHQHLDTSPANFGTDCITPITHTRTSEISHTGSSNSSRHSNCITPTLLNPTLIRFYEKKESANRTPLTSSWIKKHMIAEKNHLDVTQCQQDMNELFSLEIETKAK